MKYSKLPATLLAAAIAAAAPARAASGDLKTAATKLSTEFQDAVVWISVIAKTALTPEGDVPAALKQAGFGQEKEEKSEATGTIIDASGLIVTSLASIDQSSQVDGKTINTPVGAIKLRASWEVKEAKIIMPDGTEIPADLVMKDKDLGLAFLKVRADSKEAQGVTFKAIDLKNSVKGTVLDDVIQLGRMDETMNREASVFTSEISGITKKPREIYRVMTDSFGCPAFNSDGKVLGISVLRPLPPELTGANMRNNPAVLPAAEVAKIAEQAKNAKPQGTEDPKSGDEKKPSDKKDGGRPTEEPKKEGASN